MPTYLLLLLSKSKESFTPRMPPANAAAISRVLKDIANFSPPLLTRPAQQTYLTKLTSEHKFTYYSATYGHTIHDAASLRKVLANTMRHHPNPEFGIAGGNAAVDTLFQFGCEMLEPGYVDEVMRAGLEAVVERREEEEEEEEESSEDELGETSVGDKNSGHADEDFVPVGKRLRKRGPPGPHKRKISTSSSEESSSSKDREWQDPPRKMIKRKHAICSVLATSPSCGSKPEGGTKTLDHRRRSHVGEYRVVSHLQRDAECGRAEAETVWDQHQGCRRLSVVAGHSSQPRQVEQSSLQQAQSSFGQSDHAKLREAVERLNRRVQTAIVQLWDEIGDVR